MKWHEQWVEAMAMLFLVIGFIIAVLLSNSGLNYLTIFLAGALAARVYTIKRYKGPILPLVLVIIGFLLGYLIGSFWINRLFILLLFALGFLVSRYIHMKKVLTTFKSGGFIK